MKNGSQEQTFSLQIYNYMYTDRLEKNKNNVIYNY